VPAELLVMPGMMLMNDEKWKPMLMKMNAKAKEPLNVLRRGLMA